MCSGDACVIELVDAFHNLVADELEVVAALEVATDLEQAGITVSTDCKCTGSNKNANGAVGTANQLQGDFTLFVTADGTSDYGTYCARWDSSSKDCRALWPNCTAGWWCCRPWCYVNAACPGAVEDALVKVRHVRMRGGRICMAELLKVL